MRCLSRALIEGQLSALARLGKTEKCPVWQNFYYFFSKIYLLSGLGGFNYFLIIINLEIL